MEERLQQLVQQRDALGTQISELNFLIKGYEDTIKQQKEEAEDVPEQVEEVKRPQQKEKAKRPERENGYA